MHTCLRLDVAHIFVSLNAFTYTSCIAFIAYHLSRGVSASGGALGLFRLDVCMCQQGGEFWEKWSNKGETCLIFKKNLLCTGLRECIILGELHLWERGKNFAWGVSALVLASGFLVIPLLPAWLRRALPLSLRSHVLAFDRLRRAFALVLGDRSLLE